MPDVACEYVLTTPFGVVTFNDGSVDQFYIQSIPQGLAGAPISAPIDDVAYGDGSIGYNFWKRGRHILIEGLFLVTSIPSPCSAQVAIWNTMEDELREALDSINGNTADTATLVWTPAGAAGPRTLTVRNDVPLDCQPDQNYLVRTFAFGLFAEDPDWAGSS